MAEEMAVGMKENKLRIGVCGDLSCYEEAARLGYDHLDVYGRDMAAMSEEAFEVLAQKVDAGKMPCGSICRYCSADLQLMGDAYDAETVRFYAELVCRRSERLGIKVIGIGSGPSRTVPEGYSLEKAEAQLIEALRITAEVASRYGITVLLEPLNTFECNHLLSTASVAQFIDRVAMDNVAMVFDFHHASIMGETEKDYLPYVPYMKSAHFNEVDYETDAKRFLIEESYPIYKKWLETIIAHGYEGPFTIEAVKTEDFSGDAARSMDIVRRLKRELAGE